MKLHLTPRVGYAAGFLISGALILYALYLQYYEYQVPCPLCVLQRVAYIVLMMVFLFGALQGPRRTGAIVSSTLLVIVSLAGAGIPARPGWLRRRRVGRVPGGTSEGFRGYGPARGEGPTVTDVQLRSRESSPALGGWNRVAWAILPHWRADDAGETMGSSPRLEGAP